MQKSDKCLNTCANPLTPYKKEIQKIKHNFKTKDGSTDYKKMFINTVKSMSIIGAINLLIYVIFTFLVQLYMSKNTEMFKKFRWYHHLLWIGIIFVQVAYVIYLIIYPFLQDLFYVMISFH